MLSRLLKKQGEGTWVVDSDWLLDKLDNRVYNQVGWWALGRGKALLDEIFNRTLIRYHRVFSNQLIGDLSLGAYQITQH